MAGAALDGVALVLLTAAGAALGVLAVFDVPLLAPPLPFSLGLPAVLLANAAVTWWALSAVTRPWLGALPMGAFTAVVLVAWAGGPGGDAVIRADSPRGLLLLAAAAAPAGFAYLRWFRTA